MRIRIRRLHDDIALPAYHSGGAAAFDLAAREDAVVAPGEVRLVGTGLVVEVPRGHFLAVVARSSLPIKKGLIVANGIGVVDSDYCGAEDEVKVEVYNFTSREVAIARGERLAQGLILPAVRVEWEEVNDTSSRSRGGFGSTGGLQEPAAGSAPDATP
jgi:dUTP pyrophosphatase